MARIGRAGRAQAFNSQGPIFGPRDAIIPPPPPPFAPISVNLAVGLTTNQRRAQKRFPLQGWEDGQTTISKVVQNTITDGTGYQLVTSGSFYAQSFIAHDTTLVGVKAQISKFGSPVDQVTVSIRNDSADSPGTVITTTTFDPSSATGLAGFFDIPNLQTTLTPGTKYWLTFARTGATDAVNNYFIGAYTASGLAGARGPFPEGSYFQTGIGVLSHVDLVFSLYFANNQPGMFQRLLGPKPPTVIQVAPNAEPVRVCSQAIARRVAEKKQFPLQGFANDTPLLGVRPPTVVSQTPLAPPISVNLSAGLTTNQRRAQKRYPLQGWDAFETRTSRTNNKLAGTFSQISGGSGTTEAIAEAFPGSAANISIQFTATRFNSPTDNLVVSIQEDSGGQPSGVALWTTSIPCTSLPATPATNQYAFTPGISLADKPMYWVVYERDGVRDTTNRPAILAASGTQTLATLLTIGKARNSGVWVLGGGSATFLSLIGDETQGVFQRLLGPRPPLTLLTSFVAPPQVAVNRASRLPVEMQKKRFPLQGWEGSETLETGGAETFGVASRNLGPFPPMIIGVSVVATLDESTVRIHTASISQRASMPRRFPLQGWEGNPLLASYNSVVANNQFGSSAGPPGILIAGTGGVSEAVAQAFTATSGTLAYIEVSAGKSGTPTDDLVCEIRTDAAGLPSSTVLATSSITSPSLNSGLATVHFAFAGGPNLQPTSTYWIVLRRSGARSLPNSYRWEERTDAYLLQAAILDNGVWALPGGEYLRFLVATGGETIQTYSLPAPRRLLGPFPPLIIDALPSQQQQTVVVKNLTQAIVRREQAQQRQPHSRLFTLQTYAQPPPVESTVRVHLVAVRPRRTHSLLAPPSVLQTFAASKPTLVQTRPRHVIHQLNPPTVVRVPSVEQRQQTITVALARIRPRPTHARVSAPVALRVFDGPRVTTVKTRPRQTIHAVRPPTVVRVPSVEQQQQTITTRLVRIRPQRRLSTSLRAPQALRTFDAAAVHLVRTRPRHVASTLRPPAVVAPAAFVLYKPQVTLVRARPRPTSTALLPPTVLDTYQSGKPALARTRPRPTIHRLSPPTVIRVPAVEQEQQTIRVSLIRTRPQPTHARVSAPAVLQTFDGPDVTLARIRPPRTHVTVELPTVLQVFDGPTVALATIRPPETRSKLSAPIFYAQTSTITTRLVAVESRRVSEQQRAPHSHLSPPTVLQTFAGPVEEQVTVRTLLERPRHAPHYFLRPPTIVRVPSVEQQQRTITTRLVTTRPRPTTKTLRPPTVVSRPPVGEIVTSLDAVRTRVEQPRRFPLQGWRHRIVRETGSVAGINMSLRDPFLGPRPPQIIDPLPLQQQQTIRVNLDSVRTRVEQKRHYPLPGFRQRLVRETGQTITCQMRDPLLGPRPPVIIDPLPTQREQTIKTTLVAVRTRYEQKRHAPHSQLEPPTVVDHDRFNGPSVNQIRIRPRPTTRFLTPPTVARVPTVEQQLRTIRVDLTRTRPRPTIHALAPPTVLRTFTGPQVALTETRPRPTTTFLRPPTVVRVPSVEQRQQTITTRLVRTRPAATSSRLRTPAFTPPVVTRITVKQTRIRPRDTQARLLPLPVTAPARVVEETIRVALAQPVGFRRVRSHLFAPIVAQATLEQQTIRVRLVRTRPQATVALLAVPIVNPRATLAQQTILVKLAGFGRLLVPAIRSKLRFPSVTVTPAPGVTWGEDVAATAVEDYDVAATSASNESTVAGTAVESSDSAAVDSRGEDVPATAVESEDREAGT